ncbi:hypothetical protein HPB52_003140 [Rhipicephalus sanguineus]|uniref:Tick transposon n=1 Tax=Rhipicephalus sanguineus TaxID=34632 RepID=A0A9D4SVL2_RHISA|nr:hypothetical protein HPB52_003140 [Rhipicephalus sanguineus]
MLVFVKGLHYALYADDITIWTYSGSPAEIEDRIQRAALIVDTYASLAWSIFLPFGPIPVVRELRTLGLHISPLNHGSTIARLRSTSEQVSRMIRRVSTKRGGFRGRHSLRLAHAFVTR